MDLGAAAAAAAAVATAAAVAAMCGAWLKKVCAAATSSDMWCRTKADWGGGLQGWKSNGAAGAGTKAGRHRAHDRVLCDACWSL
jgi:hypothetical protein